MNKNYDLRRLQIVMGDILQNPSNSNLNNLKRELNRFFNDSECLEVVYTKNHDRLFFGMSVLASIDRSDYEKVINGDEPYRIKNYRLEIDSKLLDMNMTERELTAIVLHEIGHLVNDSTPIEKVRNAMDVYMDNNMTNLSLKDVNKDLLMWGVYDSLRKFTSIFNKHDEEILADNFVFMLGYGDDLENAFKKIMNNTFIVNKYSNTNKLIQLEWILKIYKGIGISRLSAIKTLNRAKSVSPSKLEKDQLQRTINALKHDSNDSLRESYLLENSNKSIISRVQRKGLRALEEDLYEFEIRIKNVKDEDDALFILRQMNSRMSIIDDYIYNLYNDDNNSNKEYEIERYRRLYDNYFKLREVLSNKASYNKYMYRLFMVSSFDDYYK